MRNAILGAAGAALVALSAALSPVAQAADLPVKGAPAYAPVPTYSWDGFFMYGSLGFADLTSDQNWGQSLASLLVGGRAIPTFIGSSQSATPSASSTGFFGGGGVGAQKAYGNFLIGVRLDVDSLGQGTTAQTVIGQINTNSHLFGTGNVRAGFTFDDWYLYGTGGVAWDRVCINTASTGSNACNSGVGYMIGAGVEYDYPLPQWSKTAALFIGAEYRYYKVDGIDANLTAVNVGTVGGVTVATGTNTVMSNTDSLQAVLLNAGLKF